MSAERDARHPMNPIDLQVARHLLEAVAAEMGHALERTAHSANITQRRDFSCAVFDPAGNMTAQATHIPVHLGSMPASVAAVLDTLELEDGGHAILNDPYAGGSHLPDVTLVTRVGELGYVANRAHHADVGGATPGSMVLAEHVDREGVRLPPMPLAEGEARLLAAVRNPDETRADLAAQVNANRVGAARLRELAGRLDLAAAGRELRAYAGRLMRATVAAVPDGTCTSLRT